MNYPNIRNTIIKELAAYLGKQVVMVEQAHKKPPSPFIGYKVTTPYNPERGQPAEMDKAITSAAPNFDYDIERTITEQPTMTISFTAYAKTEDEAISLAMQAYSWFYFDYDILSGNNIVVVEATSVQNRDTLIVDDYERRQGFDVILRVAQELKRTMPTIETAEIKGVI